MSLSRCPRCGELFARERYEVCAKCRNEENERLDLIKRYIDSHSDASVEEMSKISGLEPDEILHYVRKGRLLAEEFTALEITCEECGQKIVTGRFCKQCRERLAKAFLKILSRIKFDKNK
ncbi:TPA: hypothetical protein DEF17_03260 [bacterium]|nr:MAG: hypothetical protein AUJ18_07375 [Candidatus Hydrogenedentes bacterium CG1_02_42_14]HBW46938.1 hypothetical protein [bacterium]